MTEQEFVVELEKIGIKLTEEQISQFKIYGEFLLKYNEHTNITAIRTIEGVYLKHFYDSLLALKYFSLDGEKVLDVGSGGGFPGVPIKICLPSIELTLLDSNGKKTKFLKELKSELGIDYEVINDRAESFAKSERENFDVVVSRAVASLPVLSELCIPFVKVGGYFISYKGNIEDEIEDGVFAIETLGATIEKIEKTTMVGEDSNRTFIIALKKCKTGAEYPRVFDKISKKPLQKKRI